MTGLDIPASTLHREARRQGKQATHRVDLWHATQHIWAVANDLYGNDTPEARQWAQERISWLKRRRDGAMESTCAQYQCRFKRTGQFWSLEGDEAFLALQTLHWNGRWHLLFPHDRKKE